MKNFIIIFAALALLACSERKQRISRKKILYGTNKIDFNQALSQTWMLNDFESVKRDFALFHKGVNADEVLLEITDILQNEKGYAVVFDYKTKQGWGGQFIVSTLSVITDGTFERTNCSFNTDMFYLSSVGEDDCLEYSLKKNREGQVRLMVKSEKGIVKVGVNNLGNVNNSDSIMMTFLEDDDKKVNTLVYQDSLGNTKTLQSFGNICLEDEADF